MWVSSQYDHKTILSIHKQLNIAYVLCFHRKESIVIIIFVLVSL